MSYTKLNRSAATLTKNRTEGSISPFSGMCVTCVDGCIGMCEIGKSAYRGHEVLYPQPFGIITAASEKDYPADLSDFTIMGTAVGAHGVEADSDKATFPKVTIESAIGHDKGIKMKVPFVVSGMGSTNVAKQNWHGLGAGDRLLAELEIHDGERGSVGSERSHNCHEASLSDTPHCLRDRLILVAFPAFDSLVCTTPVGEIKDGF